MSISKQTFVRIISFGTAIIAALAVYAAMFYNNAGNAKRQLEYSYMRAAEDLSLSLENIKNTLNKGIYASSPSLADQLAEKLVSDAATAKMSLAQLPVEELELSRTYKFLSQVGNYARSLAEKMRDGGELTDEERENLLTLYSYAEEISDEMWSVEQQLESGCLTFEKVSEIADNMGTEQASANVTEGFTDFEEGFESYPTLIYDGPFSDHILEKAPLMTEGKAMITQEKALEIAVSVSGCDGLVSAESEKGKMPSYVFECEDRTVSVTQNGGYLNYMLNYRRVPQKNITAEKAVEIAEDYLEAIGYTDMEDTYYEINSNICVINFAAEQDGAILYTDLIKAGVALDNGEIMSIDCRGYLTNHYDRTLPKAEISAVDAISRLSPQLICKKVNMCVIPSGGQNELYCYEFHCTDTEGKQALVYVNAMTGEEEQILLLKISGNGTLTV